MILIRRSFVSVWLRFSGVNYGENAMMSWLNKLFNLNTELDLDSKLDQRVVLSGIAENGKAGALLTIGEQPIYIEGLESWDESLYGKKVTVEGVLRRDEIFAQSGILGDVPVQGMSSQAFYLEEHRVR